MSTATPSATFREPQKFDSAPFAAPVQFQRYAGNPILEPNPANDWENKVTTNPAAWLEADGTVRMLYRAAGHDDQHKIYFGLAESSDGLNFKRVSDKPIFGPSENGFDAGCVEDPRVVKIGDFYFITYAVRAQPPGLYWLGPRAPWKRDPLSPETPIALRENYTVTGLAMTRDFKTWFRAGPLTDRTVDDRDVMLFPETISGQWYMVHRPMQWTGPSFGTDHPAIWISKGKDMFDMGHSRLLAKAQFPWECKVGGNTPPMKTDDGWLMLYHGVGPDKHYRLGAIVMDLNDPTIVRYRSKGWLLEPAADYEVEGYYKGVVFPCGKLLKDGKLYTYYGGGDRVVGVATCDFKELMAYLRSCPVNAS
ncbi:MAG: glycosidase [Phycisphaera sp.]|nr:glycosidase [Phycisphaera sp.]